MEKIKRNQPEILNEPQDRDLFQTPDYAVDLLVPFIPKWIKTVWECAAGNGKITTRLEHYGYGVYTTDIKFNQDWTDEEINFLTNTPHIDRHSIDCIITNPPFSLKKKFFDRCMVLKFPFALLIPADYSGWVIKAIQTGAEKIIPTRRIDYITPSGLSGAGGHTSNFHSMWLTKGFNLGQTETFVELTNKMKENI